MKFRCLVAALTLITPGFCQSSSGVRPGAKLDRAVVSSQAAARFLDQATWGPTPDSIAQVQSMGFTNWLAAQFALNTSDLPDQPILNSAGKSNNNIQPVQAAFFNNAVTGQDQLRQRVAFILSQIWVVSQQAGLPQAYAYPPYWRIFRDNAFGNYRDVIKAVTLSPAMGRYLNMANNNKANPAKGTVPNENYARELMQLFTLGLTQLNPDGTPVLIKTMSRSHLQSVRGHQYGQGAHRLDLSDRARRDAETNNPAYFIGQMFAVEAEHDTTAKTIFGNVTIPGGSDRRTGSGVAAGCSDGAAHHGAVRQPAADRAPGDQQPQPRLHPACLPRYLKMTARALLEICRPSSPPS